MKQLTTFTTLTTFAVALCLLLTDNLADAAGPKVSEKGNKHNLSALAWSGGTLGLNEASNTYQAVNEPNTNPGGQQVCIFCHTPHNANVAGGAPLWNRDFSTQIFERYTSTTVRIYRDATTRAAAGYEASWQPDGASKLCLSCHDGVASLGNVLRGGPIAMKGGNNVITGLASFAPSTSKMKSGHHPVSFTYNDAVLTGIKAGGGIKAGYQLPSYPQIKLDRNGKMQCTTCHNAHQNQSFEDVYPSTTRKIAPFWVYHNAGNSTATGDHDSVCTNCHPITTGLPENKAPWP